MQDGESGHYVTRVFDDMAAVAPERWDALLAQQAQPTPFMRHAYLRALTDSGSAVARTGWRLQLFTLWQGEALAAACTVWLKSHSRGEYVFDWAWAEAYERHGLAYYPKAVLASPFTPVPGSRLLARNDIWRDRLLQAAVDLTQEAGASSLHLLWADEADLQSAARVGLMRRNGVQFHWHHPGVSSFDGFLATLRQDKRKKIRQERRKVAEAGITFVTLHGEQIDTQSWDFFDQCYAQTYAEHGNPPYLNRAFFERMAHDMSQNWVLFIARREGRPMACSLVAGPGPTRFGGLWPLLGGTGATRLPAFRGLLLPTHRVVSAPQHQPL